MEDKRINISRAIGDRIREFRTLKKMSQEELAFESDIHPAYLSKLERGEKCPTIETIYKISIGLKIPMHELMNFDIDVKPTSIEAMSRIQKVLAGVPDEFAVEAADILERIVNLSGIRK